MDIYGSKFEQLSEVQNNSQKRIDINDYLKDDQKKDLDIDGMPKVGTKLI